MHTRMLALLCALGFVSVAAGCGGGDSGGTLVTTASPGGIWQGTDSATGLAVEGIVDESGQFHFLRKDLAQFVGLANTSAETLSASFDGFAQVGDSFADGSTHGTGTLSGTVVERSSLTLAYQFTTDAGAATTGQLNLAYNPLYDLDSSLAAISGAYTDTTTGVTVTVSASGVIASQDPATGCVVNGQVSIINATYNAYAVTYQYADCTGAAAILNAVQFTGLGTLDNSTDPLRAIIAVTGQAGATELALVLTLEHQ